MRPSIVVDASAILAVVLKEPDHAIYDETLIASAPIMALATRVELGVVARRRLGRVGMAEVEGLLSDCSMEFAALDEPQALIALDAMDRYGKGRGAEPALLNYGDLFSYALAKARDLPLLYKSEDFARTDIHSALAELGTP